MAKWLEKSGPHSDIVVSSRVRMARNLRNFFFPTIRDPVTEEAVIEAVYQSIVSVNEGMKKDFTIKRIKELTETERRQMVEKHLISPRLGENLETGAMVYNEEESLIVMINEEDHIRIQALLPGLQLEGALTNANRMDDVMEEQIDYAYDEGIGYLTSCPTNVGTGVRASVMLHLPALSMTGQAHEIMQFANKIGLAVRGVYGEGSAFSGNFYQISNQVSLGVREEEIIETLREVTTQIIERERNLRKSLLQEQPMEIEDQVYRSLGILRNARKISAEEAMRLLSGLQLGISLGLVADLELSKVHQLITMIQPGSLQEYYKRKLSHHQREVHRAALLREKLRG